MFRGLIKDPRPIATQSSIEYSPRGIFFGEYLGHKLAHQQLFGVSPFSTVRVAKEVDLLVHREDVQRSSIRLAFFRPADAQPPSRLRSLMIPSSRSQLSGVTGPAQSYKSAKIVRTPQVTKVFWTFGTYGSASKIRVRASFGVLCSSVRDF